MGSTDRPPAHVSSSYLFICTTLFGLGGALWTLTYILMLRVGLQHKTYPMPLFPLCLNFAWELVFALYVAEAFAEKTVFAVWMVIDVALVYCVVMFGEKEWRHAPWIGRHLGWIVAGGTVWCCVLLYAVVEWWLDPSALVNPKPGRWYKGVEGPDTTELGYWTALVAQAVDSLCLLAQLVVRWDSRGTSWGIWGARFTGTMSGLVAVYWYAWWVWPEGNGFIVCPVSVVLLVTSVAADIAYPFVLARIQRDEKGTEGKKVK